MSNQVPPPQNLDGNGGGGGGDGAVNQYEPIKPPNEYQPPGPPIQLQGKPPPLLPLSRPAKKDKPPPPAQSPKQKQQQPPKSEQQQPTESVNLPTTSELQQQPTTDYESVGNESINVTTTQQQNLQSQPVTVAAASRRKCLCYQKGGDNTICKLIIITIAFGIIQNVYCIVCLCTDFFYQSCSSVFK